MKKTILYLTTFLISIFLPNLASAQSWWQTTYQATESTILQAHIITYDNFPPSPPELITPAHESHLCDPYPVFSFKEAIDDEGVTEYTFNLQGDLSNKSTFSFERTFSGPVNHHDYQVWFENGIYYLKLKQALDWGTYHWRVIAHDAAHNQTSSSTYRFYLLEEECRYDCENLSLLPQVKFSAPNGLIDNRNPAMIFDYPPSGLPVRADIYVDNALIFSNISFINQNTAQYSVIIDDINRKVIIQPLLPYLPIKNTSPTTYQIKAILTDANGCEYETPVNDLRIVDLDCTVQILIPYLISPVSDYVTNEYPHTFVWDICTSAVNITNQKFTLNGLTLWTLGTSNFENDDYRLRVENLGPSACGPTTLRYTLTLKKTSYQVGSLSAGIRFNDPLDFSDWNNWSVQVTGCYNYTASSSIRRIRYLPRLIASYSWCTDQNTCTSGTLDQCLNANRHCYYQDHQQCMTNAPQDCSATPPSRTYHWCINQSQCTSGTLADCHKVGRNCYVNETSLSGDGCLQRAKYDCSQEAKYFWCTGTMTCNLGSFADCLASGKPCYRQEPGMDTCPSYVTLDCPISTGLLVNNPFAARPNFLPNLLTLLGLSPRAIQLLDTLSTQLFPYISIFMLLPIGLLIIFFPRPRGLVFDSQTKKAITDALVVVIKEGKFVTASITNKNGFFTGFKLSPGEYYLQVSSPKYLYPSQKKREDRQSIQNFYLADKFYISSEFDKMITFQIPMDLDLDNYAQEEQKENQFNLKWRLLRLLSSLINALGLLWGITFAIVIIFTLIYPIWLNLIILGVYLYGLFRRIIAGINHFNLEGQVVNQAGEPLSDIPLYLNLVAHDRLAAKTITDEQGNFIFHANYRLKYYLSTLHFNFVNHQLLEEKLYLDLNQKKLKLQLVIKEKDNV